MENFISISIHTPTISVDDADEDIFVDYSIDTPIDLFFNKIPAYKIFISELENKLKEIYHGDKFKKILNEVLDSNLDSEYHKYTKIAEDTGRIVFYFKFNKSARNFPLYIKRENISYI